jgi:hypothetical protein
VRVNVRRDDQSRKDYICFFLRPVASCCAFMTDTNLNYWGELVVPVGVSICFGVALLVWLRDELRAKSGDEQEEQDQPR